MFIATANTLETIPKPLIDRMEIIELKAYTRTEKLMIAKNHLVPKQLKLHGLNRRTFKITDEAINEICCYYTREAGVRNLEKQIAAICRKSAKRIVSGEANKVQVNTENIKDFLGARKILPEKINDRDEIGLVNGLAYTEVGGDMLEIETAVLDGSGKIELTGSLGDVMKESARAAVSYIRSRASELNISPDFYKTKDIHIHVPEGAIPKDGPSAGITMMTSLVSALTGLKVHRDVAMTGEITLRGRVLAIGGLKEKTMAAYVSGIKKVIIPADNVRDLEEIDPEARANLTFIPCKTADEVLSHALVYDDNKFTYSFSQMNRDYSNTVNNTDIPSENQSEHPQTRIF
jgi:ATP-dependent Lon protease